MAPHLGAPFNPGAPAWGYATDDRLAPIATGGAHPAMTMGHQNKAMQPPVITVFDVTPQQGIEGTPIRIICDLNFRNHSGDTTGNRVRVTFGKAIVEPNVVASPSSDTNYIVTALVPPIQETGSQSWSVPMLFEAYEEQHCIDRQSLGDFHYLADAGGTPKRTARKKLETDSPGRKALTGVQRTPIRRRREDDMPYPTIAAGAAASFVYDSPPQATVLPPSQPGLVRTTQMLSTSPQASAYMRTKARLEIDGDLNTMKANWSPDMWANRRCLVQFTRRQEGAVVRASFKAVEEKDWTPNMIVISCLYHDARSDCYFTSVDAIYLLECLMGTRYTTEEKNRIRRNLESFKPTTLQKNEGQWQDFYAHIMNYPNPKPRNIDKGLKVFPWVHLEQALKKIFANYSAYLNLPSYGMPVNADPTQVPYGHQAAPLHDPITYDDRSMMRHPHPSAGSVDELSAYVDMSPVANSAPSYGHRSIPSSGGSASATSELVAAPYANASANPDSEFTNYVNMSPTVPSAVPRETYSAPLGLYIPSQVDPSLGSAPGSSAPSSLAYGDSRSNSDLHVTYEGVGTQYPPP